MRYLTPVHYNCSLPETQQGDTSFILSCLVAKTSYSNWCWKGIFLSNHSSFAPGIQTLWLHLLSFHLRKSLTDTEGQALCVPGAGLGPSVPSMMEMRLAPPLTELMST